MAWTCPHCETLNDSKNTHCEVCGAERVALSVWICPNCETENPDFEEHCEVCDFEKSKAESLKLVQKIPEGGASLFGMTSEPSWRVPGKLRIRKKEMIRDPRAADKSTEGGNFWTRFKRLSPENKKRRLQGWMALFGIAMWVWGPAGAFNWYLIGSLIFWIGNRLGMPWKKAFEKWLEDGYVPGSGFIEEERIIEKVEDGHRNPITALQFNPEGDQIISVDERGNLMRWFAATGERRKNGSLLKERFDRVIIGKSAAYVLDGDKIKVVRPDGSQRTQVMLKRKTPSGYMHTREIPVVISSDNAILAIAGTEGYLNLVSTQNFTSDAFYTQMQGDISAMDFFPELQRIICGSAKGDLYCIDLNQRQTVFKNEEVQRRVLALTAAPIKGYEQGTFAASYQGGLVKVWRGLQDKHPMEIDLNLSELGPRSVFEAHLLRFIPQRNMLVTVNQLGVIQVWDILSDKAILKNVMATSTNDIRTLAVSPDGKRISVGGSDGSVSVFDTDRLQGLDTGEESLTIKGTLKVNSKTKLKSPKTESEDAHVRSIDTDTESVTPSGDDTLLYDESDDSHAGTGEGGDALDKSH